MTYSHETYCIALFWAKRARDYLNADDASARGMRRGWNAAGPQERNNCYEELAQVMTKHITGTIYDGPLTGAAEHMLNVLGTSAADGGQDNND